MPFFAVNFGCNDGYAHIIEDSESFPEYFGKVIYVYFWDFFTSVLRVIFFYFMILGNCWRNSGFGSVHVDETEEGRF